jgi:hypothetical protein
MIFKRVVWSRLLKLAGLYRYEGSFMIDQESFVIDPEDPHHDLRGSLMVNQSYHWIDWQDRERLRSNPGKESSITVSHDFYPPSLQKEDKFWKKEVRRSGSWFAFFPKTRLQWSPFKFVRYGMVSLDQHYTYFCIISFAGVWEKIPITRGSWLNQKTPKTTQTGP